MLAARIGIRQEEFEHLTPRELSLCADAYGENLKDEARMSRAKIYSLAAAIRAMICSKYPPRYEDLFPEDIHREEMTDEAMFAHVKALNRLFGGTEG